MRLSKLIISVCRQKFAARKPTYIDTYVHVCMYLYKWVSDSQDASGTYLLTIDQRMNEVSEWVSGAYAPPTTQLMSGAFCKLNV